MMDEERWSDKEIEQQVKSRQFHTGYYGYCLDPDDAIDLLKGMRDEYEQHSKDEERRRHVT